MKLKKMNYLMTDLGRFEARATLTDGRVLTAEGNTPRLALRSLNAVLWINKVERAFVEEREVVKLSNELKG